MTDSNKISLERKRLLKALNILKVIVSATPIVPIIENVLIQLKEGLISVRATDLQNDVVIFVGEGEINSSAVFLIDYSILLKLISTLKCENVSFEVKGDKVNIVCEEGFFTLQSDPWEDYPKRASFASSIDLSVPYAVVKEGYTIVESSICTDDLRPAMTGVFFVPQDELLHMVATNGHTLADYGTAAPFNHTNGFILQKKVFQLFVAMKEKDGQTVSIKFGSTNALITCGSVYILSRMIDERFPDYNNAIPTHSDFTMDVNVAPFLHKIKLAGIFSSRTTHQIAMTIHNSVVTLISKEIDYDLSSTQAFDVVNDIVDQFEIGFNAKFMTGLLKPFSDKITFGFTKPNRAILVFPKTKYGEKVQALIMPVMLTSNDF